MFKLYLVTAWRNLRKNRLISLINIFGLTIGLTCSLFAIYYSVNELTYENCHLQAKRISKIFSFGKIGSLKKLPATFAVVGYEIKDRFPEVDNITISRKVNGIMYKDQQPFSQDDIVVADAAYFDLFDIDFIQGSAPVAGQEIALSEKTAKKYFDIENCIGKSLRANIWGNDYTYTVTGIFSELPNNTHLEATAFISLDMAQKFRWNLTDYDNMDFDVYALTNEGTDIPSLNNKIAQQYDIPVDIIDYRVALVPIKRIHLHETLDENNLSNLLIILIGGIVALVLSCFSYVNLTAILFSTRKKEVGIKKVNGSGRREIIFQFLIDTGLTVLISLVLAYTLFKQLLPDFNSLLDRQLSYEPNKLIGIVIIGTFVFTTLFSGLLPAWSLSRSKPVSLVQRSISVVSRNRLKNSLLTLQFIVAIILLQFFLISQRQGNYMFKQNVCGYDGEDVWVIDGYQWGDLNVVKNELLKNSAIEYVSWTNGLPGINLRLEGNWGTSQNNELAQIINCTDDYLKVFGIDLKEGRFFEEEYMGDDRSIIINSLTANSLGINDPIGKRMQFQGREYQIIGQVKDYLAVPVIFDEMPLIFIKAGKQEELLTVKVNNQRTEEAKAHIKNVLQKANPNFPVELKTFNELGTDLARSFIATGTLMNLFTIIIIINAMMGLFGLSYFIAQYKNKEVGIRKVCGASVNSVVWRLSKGFALKLLLALSIATPFTYLAGGEYVKTFTRHIEMSADLFILGGGMALLMVFLAAGWKISLAAIRNPVEALRYE